MSDAPAAALVRPTNTGAKTIPLSLTLVQAALGAGVCFATGGLVAYALARRRFAQRQRDAARAVPPSELRAHFDERVSVAARKQRVKTTAAASSSAAATAAAAASTDDDAVVIRAPVLAEADEVAVQFHEAFNFFNETVKLPPEFPSLDFSKWLARICIEHDLALIARARRPDGTEGEVLGSVFNDEIDIVDGAVGCGPWSARWGALNQGVGRRLVQEIVSTSIRHGAKSIRLIQISANLTAWSLYTSLGFVSREPVTAWRGEISKEASDAAIAEGTAAGLSVRAMTKQDLIDACDPMHREALGISRIQSLTNNLNEPSGPLTVVLDAKKRVIGYNNGLRVINHTLVRSCASADTSTVFRFLLASVMAAHPQAPESPTMLHTCSRLYPEIDRWLLQSGVRVHRAVNLMVLGEWQPIKHDEYIYAPTITY